MAIGRPITETPNIADKIISVIATAGQTEFTVTGGYRVNHLAVFRNGVRLVTGRDYIAGDGLTVELIEDASLNDVLEFQVFDTFSISDAIVGNSTSQTLTGDLTVNGTLTVGASGIGTLTLDTMNVGIISSTTGITTIISEVAAASTSTGALQVMGGVGIGKSLFVGGNLSVGGTVTYEDVTNIDSVGLVTAGKGLRATTGGLVVTAGVSTFTGAVTASSTLTVAGNLDIADTIYHTGDSNTKIRFPSADTITAATSGSERVRIDSNGRVIVGHTASTGEDRILQVVGTTADTSSAQLIRHSADSSCGQLDFSKSRNATKGSNTVVQSGDALGQIVFRGDDGSDLNTPAATISASVDGTPGSNDMPGRLEFSTTADGGSDTTERIRITSAGDIEIGTQSAHSNTIKFADGTRDDAVTLKVDNSDDSDFDIVNNRTSGDITLATNSSERLRIDSGGRILIGATASQDVYTTSTLQIQGTTAATTTMSLLGQGRSPYLSLGATGGSSLGAVTAVSSGDRLGQITFCGADGTDVNTHSCSVSGYCDGSVSSNAVPGRMVFKTSTGASEVERMRLHSGGQLSLGTTSGPGEIGLYLGDGSNPAGHIYANGTHHMYILANAYYSSGWKYLGNGEANSISLQDGEFIFTNGSANSSGAAQTLTLVERFKVTSGGNVHINGTPPWTVTAGDWRNLSISGESASSSGFIWLGNGAAATNADFDLGRVNFCNGATITAQIAGSTQTAANDDGRLAFHTKATTGSLTEAMRIDSSGNVSLAGDTDTYVQRAAANTWAMVMGGTECFRWDNTHFGIGTTDIAGHHMSIHQDNSSEALIRFTNSTSGEGSGNGCYVGISNDEELELRNVENAGASLYTNNTQRFHVNNDGDVWFDRPVDGAHTIYIRNMSTTTTSSSATTNIIDFKFNRSGGGVNLSAAKIVVGKEQEWVGAAANQDGYIAWHTALNESPAEKMRLSSGGNLMVGTTSAASSSSDEGISLNGDASIVSRRDGVMHYIKSINTGGYTGINVLSANTTVGSMTFNSGGTAWNTTSDSRLKENVVELEDGITRLKALQPKRFNYKTQPDVTQDGFIAHEAQEVVPFAVSGTKDAVATAEDIEQDSSLSIGDPVYQQLDYGKLTPLLTAALQEAIAKIETLETKVAALESS